MVYNGKGKKPLTTASRIDAGKVMQSTKKEIEAVPSIVCLHSEKNLDKYWLQNGRGLLVYFSEISTLKKS